MTKLLMIVSSARTIGLADGSEHATGYWAEEVLAPYERFVSADADLVIATPTAGRRSLIHGGWNRSSTIRKTTRTSCSRCSAASPQTPTTYA